MTISSGNGYERDNYRRFVYSAYERNIHIADEFRHGHITWLDVAWKITMLKTDIEAFRTV